MKNQGGRVDHTGKKVSSLTFIRYSHSDKHGNAMWLMRCDCGKEKVIGAAKILKLSTKSCGCVSTKTRSELGKKRWALKKDLPRLSSGYFPSLNMSLEDQQVSFDIDAVLDLKPHKTKYAQPRWNFKCPKCQESRKDFVMRYRIKYYYCVVCGHEFIRKVDGY